MVYTVRLLRFKIHDVPKMYGSKPTVAKGAGLLVGIYLKSLFKRYSHFKMYGRSLGYTIKYEWLGYLCDPQQSSCVVVPSTLDVQEQLF